MPFSYSIEDDISIKKLSMRKLTKIEEYFRSNAYKIGASIYLYQTCASTQDIAKEIMTDVINGTCVVALEQTQGRGRLGRKWLSPPGGLWLSIIVKEIEEPVFLNPILALSAIEVIHQLYQLKAKIYWPNDIYICTHNSNNQTTTSFSYTDKKVAGILTEGIHRENSIYICGIGVNINIEKEYFKQHNLPYATSLYCESGKKIEIFDFLQEFLIKFNFLYELVQYHSYDYIDNEFKKYNGLLSKYVKIKLVDGEYTGQVIDVDIREGILLKLKNNIVKNFNVETVENVKEIDYVEVL